MDTANASQGLASRICVVYAVVIGRMSAEDEVTLLRAWQGA